MCRVGGSRRVDSVARQRHARGAPVGSQHTAASSRRCCQPQAAVHTPPAGQPGTARRPAGQLRVCRGVHASRSRAHLPYESAPPQPPEQQSLAVLQGCARSVQHVLFTPHRLAGVSQPAASGSSTHAHRQAGSHGGGAVRAPGERRGTRHVREPQPPSSSEPQQPAGPSHIFARQQSRHTRQRTHMRTPAHTHTYTHSLCCSGRRRAPPRSLLWRQRETDAGQAVAAVRRVMPASTRGLQGHQGAARHTRKHTGVRPVPRSSSSSAFAARRTHCLGSSPRRTRRSSRRAPSWPSGGAPSALVGCGAGQQRQATPHRQSCAASHAQLQPQPPAPQRCLRHAGWTSRRWGHVCCGHTAAGAQQAEPWQLPHAEHTAHAPPLRCAPPPARTQPHPLLRGRRSLAGLASCCCLASLVRHGTLGAVSSAGLRHSCAHARQLRHNHHGGQPDAQGADCAPHLRQGGFQWGGEMGWVAF